MTTLQLAVKLACALLLAVATALGQPAPGGINRSLERLAWRPLPELSYRRLHAMTYDPSRERVVMFGGLQFTSGQVLADTWEWDGMAWLPMRPLHSPRPRMMPAMAFDPVTKRVIMFGGTDRLTDFADTWAWDGQDWKQLQPAASPSARFDHKMVFDPVRQHIVLHGGAYMPPQAWRPVTIGETWVWDGSTWVQRIPRTDPGRRRGMGFAFHARSSRIVRFGGWIDTAEPIDTWEWDGSDWLKRQPSTQPLLSAMALAADPSTGNVVGLHSHPTKTSGKDYFTWTYDGSNWRLETPQPPLDLHINYYNQLVEDPPRKQVLHYGWNAYEGGRQTWGWDGKGWHLRHDWPAPLWEVGPLVWDGSNDQVLLPSVYAGHVPQWETWAVRGDSLVKLLSSCPRILTGRYHPGVGRVIALGETQASSGIPATYSWTNGNWTPLNETTVPPFLWGSIVYDSRNDRLVLVNSNGETWEWRARSGWKQLLSSTGHGLISPFDTAYDLARQRVVLCGSDLSQEVATLEFDGQAWQRIHTPVRPPKRTWLQIEYTPELQGVVLYGADSNSPWRDTWLWDGVLWRELSIPPYAHEQYVFNPRVSTYDPGRRRVLLTYSHEYLKTAPNGIWALSFAELWASQPHPRPGESFAMHAQIPAAPFAPVLLALSGATWPGIPMHVRPGLGPEFLPLSPDPLFWASLQAGLIGILDHRGNASVPVRIPNDPTLSGRTFWTAGLRPGGPGELLRATNAVPIGIAK